MKPGVRSFNKNPHWAVTSAPTRRLPQARRRRCSHMGGVASLLRKKDARLLIAGLDSAGKQPSQAEEETLKQNRQVNTIPLNFNVRTGDTRMSTSACGTLGQDSIRPVEALLHGHPGAHLRRRLQRRDRVRKAAEELHKMILGRMSSQLAGACQQDRSAALPLGRGGHARNAPGRDQDREWKIQPRVRSRVRVVGRAQVAGC